MRENGKKVFRLELCEVRKVKLQTKTGLLVAQRFKSKNMERCKTVEENHRESEEDNSAPSRVCYK